MSAPFQTEADRQSLLIALGESAVYTPLGGDAKTIYVIHDHDVERFDVNGAPVLGKNPEAEASTADLTGTLEGGALAVDGTTYTIKAPKPDSTGMTTLSLSEKA